MRSAMDRYSRKEVDPADATRGPGRYLCGCCEAPVHLVQSITMYFAHDKYQARQDCENYVWSKYQYTGRPSRTSSTPQLDPEEVSYLGFEVTLDGPRLALFLPPANCDTRGSIELVLRTAPRRVPLAHLSRGIRLPFPLHDASWVLRATDDVCEDYLARLPLGRHSLEPERNLFSANGAGRQIPERATVMLGDSIWWIGRTDVRGENVPPTVQVEHITGDHGWYVFLVTLPAAAQEVLSAQIARWLQRRIQPRRARVWVESPFPRGSREDGVPIYTVADGPLVIRADQHVALQISGSTGTLLFEAENVLAGTLADGALGELTIYADGVRVARIERRSEMPRPLSSVVVKFDDGSQIDLVNLQEAIEAARAVDVSELSGLLRWSPASLRSRLNHGGSLGKGTAIEAELRLRPGSTIDFDKLGYAAWASEGAHAAPVVTLELLNSGLLLWLASVGTPTASSREGRRLSLRPGAALKRRFPELRRLSVLSWPIEFAAQVRAAANLLERMR